MTLRVAVAGAGPAGFAVASALLADTGLDVKIDKIGHHESRADRRGAGLYVAGWAGRAPSDKGSHFDDAAAVVAAIHADIHTLSRPRHTQADALIEHSIAAPGVDGWSAVEAVTVLLGRFAGEGKAPLDDYEVLVDQVDED
jgi:hypothetical protein